MIRFSHLIAENIVTEERLVQDVQYVVRNADSHGDIPGRQGWVFYEGTISYGKMRIEARHNPAEDVYEIKDAFMLMVFKKPS